MILNSTKIIIHTFVDRITKNPIIYAKRLIHLSIIFFLLCPALVVAQNSPLETQLKKAIEGKKAEIGIAVIIDGQDTITINNDIHYPMMSVFKFHQALALADYMHHQKQPLKTRLLIKSRI